MHAYVRACVIRACMRALFVCACTCVVTWSLKDAWSRALRTGHAYILGNVMYWGRLRTGDAYILGMLNTDIQGGHMLRACVRHARMHVMERWTRMVARSPYKGLLRIINVELGIDRRRPSPRKEAPNPVVKVTLDFEHIRPTSISINCPVLVTSQRHHCQCIVIIANAFMKLLAGCPPVLREDGEAPVVDRQALGF